MASDPLFKRIQAALTDPIPSSTVARVIADTHAALGEAQANRADAKAISVDPMAGDPEIEAARTALAACGDRCERLTAALALLGKRKAERLAAEEDARRELHYLEVKQRRDALVAEVETQYRAHVEALADLAARLVTSNREVEQANRDKPAAAEWLFNAETIARRIKQQNQPGMTIVGAMVLPSIISDEHVPTAWPKRGVGVL